MMSEKQRPSRYQPLTPNDLGESSTERRNRWLSLGYIYYVSFTINVQATIYWPSLWPYISELDPTVTVSFYGVVVAIYYVAAGISSPLYGLWSNKINKVNSPIILGIFWKLIGHLMYFTAGLFPDVDRKWVIFMAQLFQGIGLGCYSCFYNYIVMATTKKERFKAMAIMSCCVFLAFSLGPGFQAALSLIKPDGNKLENLLLNMYTVAALGNIGLCITDVVLLTMLFKEHRIASNGEKYNLRNYQAVGYDKLAAIVCTIAHASNAYLLVVNNTVLPEFTIIMFRWSYTISVRYNGLIQVFSGLLQVVSSIFIGFVGNRYIGIRNITLIGFTCFLMFYLFTYSWPGESLLLASIPVDNTTNMSNKTMYSWASWTSHIHLWQYLLGYTFMAVGLATLATTTNTLYSNIVGKGKTGVTMGMYHCTKNLAQAIGPVISGSMFNCLGPIPIWLMAGGVILTCIILILVFYKRLVPSNTAALVPEENTYLLSGNDIQDSRLPERNEGFSTTSF